MWKKKVIIDKDEKLLDEKKTDSKITMNVIQQITNIINPMIKLTILLMGKCRSWT